MQSAHDRLEYGTVGPEGHGISRRAGAEAVAKPPIVAQTSAMAAPAAEAVAKAGRSLLLAAMVLSATVRGAGAWEPASWGGGDTVLSLAIHPGDDRVLWALTWLGGVLRTVDQGGNWLWANGDLTQLEGVAVVADPASADAAYFVGGSGIWHTEDAGAHWALLPGTSAFTFTRAAGTRPLLVGSGGAQLVAGTASGALFVSQNRGRAWERVEWGNSKPVFALCDAPARGMILIALADSAGLHVLRPAAWKGPRVARGAPPFPIKDLLADESPPYNLFAVCGQHGLWSAEPTGDDWRRLEIEGVDESEELVCLARTGRGGERLLFACGRNALLRSMNGKHWARLPGARHYDERVNPTRRWSARASVPTALVGGASPDNLFMSDYSSVHRSINASGDVQFVEAARGLANQVICDLALDGRGALLVAGDASGVLASADGGETYRSLWPLRYGPDVGRYASLAVGPGDALIAAAIDQWKGEVCVFHGIGGESRRAGRAEGIDVERMLLRNGSAPAGPWKVVFAPADPHRAYLLVAGATPGFFVSNDDGKTWKARALPRGAAAWRALAADPERPDRVYMGSLAPKAGVWRSSDGGGSWEQLLETRANVAALEALPEAVLCMVDTQGTFRRSSTRGGTWDAPVATGLAGVSAWSIDARNPARMAVAAGNSVSMSLDGGKEWTALPALPMHLPDIVCLCIDGRTGMLFAGTRGAGLWKIDLGPDAK